VTTARAARLLGGGVLAALMLAGVAAAEPPDDRAELRPDAAARPVFTPEDQARIGAATLFLNGFPGGGDALSEVTFLSAGEAFRYWSFYDPDVVREIPPWALSAVRDKTGMTQELGDPEQDAYFDMLIFANRTSPAALDNAALREGDLWSKLFHEPEKYRGKVVHFDGRLQKLRQFDPQPMAAQGGVKDYYEGELKIGEWENPVVIEFTELPPGLKTGDHLDVPAGFSGYFFKIWRYKAQDTKKEGKDRYTPVVIGRTVTLQQAPAPAGGVEAQEGPWSIWLGPLFFGVVGLTVALLFTMGYWFRAGDRRVRGRVVAARFGEFVAPPHDAPPDPREVKKAARNEPPPPSPLVDEPPGEETQA
jgi:hypothetical protein